MTREIFLPSLLLFRTIQKIAVLSRSFVFSVSVFFYALYSAHLSAQQYTLQEPDVRLVIDVSESMAINDPRNLRKPALEMFVRLLPEYVKAGAWTFSDDVNLLIPHGLVDESWRVQAEQQARLINSVGSYSNLNDALIEAGSDFIFQPASIPFRNNRSVVLLTDGLFGAESTSVIDERAKEKLLKRILPSYTRNSVKIHAVALSTNADIELLKHMARVTGGTFSVSRNAKDLQAIFLQAFDASVIADRLPVKRKKFDVDGSILGVSIFIPKSASNDPVYIVSPSEKEIDAQSKESNVTWFQHLDYDIVDIENPEHGQWRVVSRSEEQPRVVPESEFKLAMAAVPQTVYVGEKVPLSVSLSRPEGIEGFADRRAENLTLLTTVRNIDTNELVWKAEYPVDSWSQELQVEDLETLQEAGTYRLIHSVTGPRFNREVGLDFSVIEPVILNFEKSSSPAFQRFSVRLERGSLKSPSASLAVAYYSLAENRYKSEPMKAHGNSRWSHSLSPTEVANGVFHIVWSDDESAKKTMKLGRYDLPKSIAVSPVAPVVPATPAAVEPKTVKPTIKVDVKEQIKEKPEEIVEQDSNSWLVYASLALANFVIIGGLYFLYRRITSADDEEKADEQNPDELIEALEEEGSNESVAQASAENLTAPSNDVEEQLAGKSTEEMRAEVEADIAAASDPDQTVDGGETLADDELLMDDDDVAMSPPDEVTVDVPVADKVPTAQEEPSAQEAQEVPIAEVLDESDDEGDIDLDDMEALIAQTMEEPGQGEQGPMADTDVDLEAAMESDEVDDILKELEANIESTEDDTGSFDGEFDLSSDLDELEENLKDDDLKTG